MLLTLRTEQSDRTAHLLDFRVILIQFKQT